MATIYDTIVIGGGLTGLLLTHRLHQAGQKVALLEARDHLGGRYRRKSETLPYSSPGLDFFPATENYMQTLEWLRSRSIVSLQLDVREHRPQLFDEARWKPFAGFGEADFASVGELSHFTHTTEVRLNPGLEHVTRALVEQLPVAAETMSEVTGFKTSGKRITEAIVNDDKHWQAERFIFTGYPTQLNDQIQGEALPAKHRTRLAKMDAWTAVTLDLVHQPALEEDAGIRFFAYSGKDFEPVLGRVFGTHSKWMILVPNHQESEHEFVGQCIRHIKRQLKRAWPLALEGNVEEKLYIQPRAYGQYSLRTKENYGIPELENLYMANHVLGSLHGDLAAVQVAEAVEKLVAPDAPKNPNHDEDRDV